jgi:hypothetical protein
MTITFRIVTIGERFTLNGNAYIKTSTRTGKMIETGKTFYIEQLAPCSITL